MDEARSSQGEALRRIERQLGRNPNDSRALVLGANIVVQQYRAAAPELATRAAAAFVPEDPEAAQCRVSSGVTSRAPAALGRSMP